MLVCGSFSGELYCCAQSASSEEVICAVCEVFELNEKVHPLVIDVCIRTCLYVNTYITVGPSNGSIGMCAMCGVLLSVQLGGWGGTPLGSGTSVHSSMASSGFPSQINRPPYMLSPTKPQKYVYCILRMCFETCPSVQRLSYQLFVKLFVQ